MTHVVFFIIIALLIPPVVAGVFWAYMSKLPQERKHKQENNNKKMTAADFAKGWNPNAAWRYKKDIDDSEKIKEEIRKYKNKNTEKDKYGDNFSSHNVNDIPECFLILGFDRYPTIEELKKRYRDLVKEYHPDKEGGNSDKFEKVNKAYSEAKKYF